LELEARVASEIATLPPRLKSTQVLASFPIPGAGIKIPGIFELGAIIAYEVGVDSSINGAASFTFGVAASLPNSGLILADIINPANSRATGFGGATFDPIFKINSGSATLDVMASSRPKLTFGLDVVG
jgi:hypothetical protein